MTTTEAARYTLDGFPVTLDELHAANPNLDAETCGRIARLRSGEVVVLGGGAGAQFVLRREPETTPRNSYLDAIAEIDAKLGSAIATLQELQNRIRQRTLDEIKERMHRPLAARPQL